MTDLDELVSIIKGNRKSVFISIDHINLVKPITPNVIFIMTITGEFNAAGGRAGGIGQRTFGEVHCFVCRDDSCKKVFVSNQNAILEQFEIPSGIARLPVTLPDGKEETIHGVIDPETVARYAEIIHTIHQDIGKSNT